MSATRLTPAQREMLAEVRESGRRIYNGRARRTVQALEAAGLVKVEYDLNPHRNGSWTERLTVTPVGAAAVVYDRERHAFRFAPATTGLRRFTAFVHFRFAPGHDGLDIEEIDVDARNRSEARAIAQVALDRDYEPGGRIARVTERIGLYL